MTIIVTLSSSSPTSALVRLDVGTPVGIPVPLNCSDGLAVGLVVEESAPVGASDITGAGLLVGENVSVSTLGDIVGAADAGELVGCLV